MKTNKALIISIIILVITFMIACNIPRSTGNRSSGSQSESRGGSNDEGQISSGSQRDGDVGGVPSTNSNINKNAVRGKAYGLISYTANTESHHGITYVDFDKRLMAESTWGSLQVENNLDYRVDYINVSRFVGDNLKHVGEIEGINNNCSYDDSIILPDNLLVVHCGESNLPYEPRIELWDLEKMEKINSQPTDKSILTLIDSPDGDIVVGSDWDGSTNRTKIWEIPSLKELPKPDFMGSYQFLESSLNNEYFWGENYYGVFMYKFSNGNIIDVNDEFPFNQIEDGDFAFNEDNSIVAFFDPREDTITVWDRVNNKEIIKIKNSNADGIILSPKGDQLIVSNWNGNIVIKKKKITLGKGQVFGINPHQFFNLVSMVCQSRQSIFN